MRAVEESFRDSINQAFQSRFSFVLVPGERWHPPADVFETDREIVMRMELAGVDGADIQIVLEGRRLTVQGIRRESAAICKKSYHRMEIHYGPFRRSLMLPHSIDTHGIKAAFHVGILELQMTMSDRLSEELLIIAIE